MKFEKPHFISTSLTAMLLWLVFMSHNTALAQTGIGTTSPNPSAILDLTSGNRGFLPPRMSWTQIQAIPNPTAGLLVYDTGVQSIRMYTGTEWVLLGKQTQLPYDAPGAFSATLQSSIGGYAIPAAIRLDAANNVLVSGAYNGPVTLGGVVLPPVVSPTAFFGKFDAFGNLLWIKTLGVGGTNTYAITMALDGAGNIYLGGQYQGTVDFDPGVNVNTLTATGNADGFYAKYDSSGNWVWSKSVGGPDDDNVKNIAIDGNSLFVSGEFSGAALFNGMSLTSTGSTDVYVARYQISDGSRGANGWAVHFGGSGIVAAGGLTAYFGGVLVGGIFSGACSFSGPNKTAQGTYDGFLVQLNSLGAVSNVSVIGGSGGDGVKNVATDASGNIFATGYYEHTVDFNLGAGTANLTSIGGADGFVVKYNSSMAFQWATAQSGTTGTETGTSLAVDTAGNVYVAGTFGSSSFSPSGSSGYMLSNYGDALSNDNYLIKLSADGGRVLWAHSAGSVGNDNHYEIAVTADGKHLYSADYMGEGVLFHSFIGYNHVRYPYVTFYLARYEE